MTPSYVKFWKKNIFYRIFDVLNITVMILLSAVMIYPFLNLLAISFSDSVEYIKGGITIFPRGFTTNAYEMFFSNKRILSAAFMSLARVVVGTTIPLFCTGLLAYVVSIRSFSGWRFMRILFLVTMFFSGGLIPSYLLMINLRLINTFHVYWIPGLLGAGTMLLIASYIQNLPDGMMESARIDGCSEFLIYCRIVIPTSIPVFACMALFAAVGQWNAWFDTVLYNKNGQYDTLQVILQRLLTAAEAVKAIQDEMQKQSAMKTMSPETLRAATSVIVTVPILLVYPFVQRFFIKGVTIGAVKA